MHKIILILVALFIVSPSVMARGGGSKSHGGGHTATHSSRQATTHKAPKASRSPSAHLGARTAPGVKRDSHGRIKRSQHTKNDFKRQHPCPATGKSSGACPGYVVDHVKALKHGGADNPSNMQWQSKEAAKQKDKRE